MTKTYQELKVRIIDEFEHLYYNDLRGEEEPMQVEIFEKFLRSKLDEVASAALAAGEIEKIGDCTFFITDFGDRFSWESIPAYNAAISEVQRRSDAWLGKNNENIEK